MCPGLHLNTHASIYEQDELLLKTDDETNELCLQWVMCLPGTTVEGVSVASRNLSQSEGERVILICHGEEVYTI